MAYINSTVVTIDAILTDEGRKLMARADGSFSINQFALSDDEINYNLYNPQHPSGSAFFGEAISSTQVNEAFPSAQQNLKYKLVTLPQGTSKLPVLNIGYAKITLKQGASLSITPQTLNYLGAGTTYEPSGYVITVADARLLSTFTGIGIDTTLLGDQSLNSISSTNISKSQVGTSFTLVGTTINTLFGSSVTSLYSQLIVVGRDSGARLTIPLTVTKNQ
jgi:hypothetical protein